MSKITTPIPIFIICRDRLNVLKESINSYHDCIGTPIDIVIHDNSSSYPPTIEYLKELQSNGTTVFWGNENSLLSIQKNIIEYLKSNHCPFYIVTDPDIALDKVKPDILEFYAFLLKEYKVPVVGPQLLIDDIPDHYPHKNRVLKIHRNNFWKPAPKLCKFKEEDFFIVDAPIDTTFGMYRRTFKFHRLNRGLRTYPPYAARHLDWYIDPDNLSEDQKHYSKSSVGGITHWSKFNIS